MKFPLAAGALAGDLLRRKEAVRDAARRRFAVRLGGAAG
jgi:hypothetical protein